MCWDRFFIILELCRVSLYLIINKIVLCFEHMHSNYSGPQGCKKQVQFPIPLSEIKNVISSQSTRLEPRASEKEENRPEAYILYL